MITSRLPPALQIEETTFTPPPASYFQTTNALFSHVENSLANTGLKDTGIVPLIVHYAIEWDGEFPSVDKIKTIVDALDKTWAHAISGPWSESYHFMYEKICGTLKGMIDRNDRLNCSLEIVTARGGKDPSALQGIMIYQRDSKYSQSWKVEFLLSASWNVERNPLTNDRCKGVGTALTNYIVSKARLVPSIPSITLHALSTAISFYTERDFKLVNYKEEEKFHLMARTIKQ